MAARPETPNAVGTAGHSRADFTTAFVVTTLVREGVLTQEQGQDVLTKEPAARARVLRAVGSGGKAAARYEVSPVEVVAAFQIPLAGPKGGILDQDRICETIARSSGVPYRKIDPLKLDMALATRIVSRPYAEKHVLLPLERGSSGQLVVAVANPFDRELVENLRRLSGTQVELVLSAKQDILKAITEIYGFRKTIAKAVDQSGVVGPQVSNFEQLVRLSGTQELEASDRPVVQAVDYLLRYAFDNRASDIHVEPRRETSVVRLRIDGVLHPVYSLPASVHAPIVSRVKTLSRMDIAEKRRPQDGRIKTEREGREVELRVSTLPTAFGEKVVIRVFDPEMLVQDIAELGFEPDEQAAFESWIAQPHGLILVTGPTGSGKTTTLYSALKALSGPDVNVTTIEDPIEMVWEAFNQVQVQPKVGLDFAGALRNILRQDPDIIMVGEIRDQETAANAIQAALTGHLVLSTLHTNDAVGAVSRLKDLGVPPFLLASTLLGSMAQRLVRRICVECAEDGPLTQDQMASLKTPLPLLPGGVRPQRGTGCVRCRGTGHYGRTAVFEMLTATAEVRESIARGATDDVVARVAKGQGMRTLREASVRKLAQGLTSFEEVIRMTS